MNYHVAVDIGASSGRVILAATDKHNFNLTEIHRFKNSFTFIDGHERWNITQITNEVLAGLAKVKAQGIDSCTVGIDTWAVDYVLLDDTGQLLHEPIAYRDSRTIGAIDAVSKKIAKETIYNKTGIQFLNFNTIYQLYSEYKANLKRARYLLMIPDYIAYVLTGKMVGESSNVSSSQLLNLATKSYDQELLAAIDISANILPELVPSGTVIGTLKTSLQATGLYPECEVIAVATHDTASAVVGIPMTEKSDKCAYLSSGTWSLIGVEVSNPINDLQAYQANYTNEWGAYNTYRFLKNITGMWSIQEIARAMNDELTYAEMAQAASLVAPFQQFINLNDERFTNPDNMIEAIRDYCQATRQKVPQTIGELTMAVYSNLALSYAYEMNRIERLTNRKIEILHIVGGGSNVALLNQLTADLLQRQVIAGPGEGTAIGNILVQMISSGELSDLESARNYLSQQIETKIYRPQKNYEEDLMQRFIEITKIS